MRGGTYKTYRNWSLLSNQSAERKYLILFPSPHFWSIFINIHEYFMSWILKQAKHSSWECLVGRQCWAPCTLVSSRRASQRKCCPHAPHRGTVWPYDWHLWSLSHPQHGPLYFLVFLESDFLREPRPHVSQGMIPFCREVMSWRRRTRLSHPLCSLSLSFCVYLLFLQLTHPWPLIL